MCAAAFTCGFTLRLPLIWRLQARVEGLRAYSDQLHDDLDLATRDIASLLGRQESMSHGRRLRAVPGEAGRR